MKKDDHIIIAIDGPAGAGKSTVAKKVANRLSLLYIDSGAMYRAAAWKALDKGIDIRDDEAVTNMVRGMKIELKPAAEGTGVLVDGKEVTGFIRTPEVTDASSRMATIGSVRSVLVELQRTIGSETGVVMEGRDIGTVVFPDTPFKFYLDASVHERARRRKKDLDVAGYTVDPEQLEREVADRDRRDSTRSVAPLRKVEDAVVIDTTAMSIAEVVDAIVDYVRQALGEREAEDYQVS